ncbi:MAG: glycosyltransferase [Lachnospiraceae bacterium]|nr:glycosyltransferase [Lachnospiraceae bacterium]
MRISMIVPIYNTGEALLRRCIESLLRQTYPELEIILVDDGSTDESGRICKEYALGDGRVKVIHKENGGEASARNAGLEAGTGQLIGFHDSDDECPENAIALLAEAMKPSVDMAVGAYLETCGEAKRIAVAGMDTYTSEEAAEEAILSTNTSSTGYIFSTVNGKLFRSELIRKRHIRFDEGFRVGSDTIFMRDYLLNCGTIRNIFLPVYIYYKYNNRIQGVSWLYPDWFVFQLQVWERDLRIIRRSSCAEETLCKVYQRMMDLLIGSLVMATAYEPYFGGELEEAVEKVIRSDLVTQAAPHYQPQRISDSTKIPKYILEKDLTRLMCKLRICAEEYTRSHKKSDRVRLIYEKKEK